MSRFPRIVPKTPGELERFYLDVEKKLGGTDATLEEVDQRSQSPVGAIQSENERALRDLVKSVVAPLKAQISELERQLRNNEAPRYIYEIERNCETAASQATKLDDLERRIDSIERSARY